MTVLWLHTKIPTYRDCFQTTNNSCTQHILSLSDRDFFDLPLPPFLPAQAPHRPLIDTDRFYPSSARPKKLCTLLLNLNLPGRTFYEVPRIFAHRKAKIHCSYLYQISRLAVKVNLMSYKYFFNTIKQNRQF